MDQPIKSKEQQIFEQHRILSQGLPCYCQICHDIIVAGSLHSMQPQQPVQQTWEQTNGHVVDNIQKMQQQPSQNVQMNQQGRQGEGQSVVGLTNNYQNQAQRPPVQMQQQQVPQQQQPAQQYSQQPQQQPQPQHLQGQYPQQQQYQQPMQQQWPQQPMGQPPLPQGKVKKVRTKPSKRKIIFYLAAGVALIAIIAFIITFIKYKLG